MSKNAAISPEKIKDTSADQMVGQKLKSLRNKRGLSLRILADRSGLNINTLSLIENGKSSPSVSTLQQLAQALDVPIAAFFESDSIEKDIVFTPANQRPSQFFGKAEMQNLGKNLSADEIQPFYVTLLPEMGSGDQMIVHTGLEFVYNLEGCVQYIVDGQQFNLCSGDSLVFKATLPHQWKNITGQMAKILLILYSCVEGSEAGNQHFAGTSKRS